MGGATYSGVNLGRTLPSHRKKSQRYRAKKDRVQQNRKTIADANGLLSQKKDRSWWLWSLATMS